MKVSGPTVDLLGSEWVDMPNGVSVLRLNRFVLEREPTDHDVPKDLEAFEVVVDMGDDGAHPVVNLLEVRISGGDGVRGAHLRFLARRWDRHVVPYLVQRCFLAATEPGAGDHAFGEGPLVVQAADFAVKSVRRTELTAEVLAEVAEVHRDSTHHLTCTQKSCKGVLMVSPVERVMAHCGLTRDGANTRIRRARDAGYLAPTQRSEEQK